MTKKLHISDDLSLPPDTVTSTLVVYGGKGMGKTNLGSVLVEELTKAGLRWCALDPLGVWWGLRHSKDGKGPGIECVILGGAHGDIPIEPTGGAVAADLVVDEPANVIIDFSRKPTGDMWSIGEKVRFVTEYALRLFQRQGGLSDGRRREPIFQALDEAARYIPQIIPSGAIDLARCVGAWETLVEEGRNVGIGVGLLTQRSARMNKSVSEVADAMLSFRIVGPNSIGAVMDWMGEHVAKEKIKAHIETLRKLPRGECLVVSPGWLQFEDIVRIRERETFDSSATPKPGERPKRVTGEAAKPDLAKYAERMKETIERVKADDPKELRRTIAELKKQVAGHKPAAAAAPLIEQQIVEVPMLKPEEIKLLSDIVAELGELSSALSGAASDVKQAIQAATQKRGAVAPVRQPMRRPTVMPTRMVSHTPKPAESNGDLSRPQIKLLHALGEGEAIGRNELSRSWLAFIAGVSPLSSGFEKNISTLSAKGLLRYPSGGRVALTEEGRAYVPAIEVPLTTDSLFERVSGLLSGPQASLLSVLRQEWPNSLSREGLAAAANVSPLSSGFEKNVSTLSGRELVEYPDRGQVKAADWLFIGEAA